jgi:hypothetical protein
MNMEPVIPLEMKYFRKSLGHGYRVGWYTQSEVLDKITAMKDETSNNINGFPKSDKPALLTDDSDNIIKFVKPKETESVKNITSNNIEISEEVLREIVNWIRKLAAQENARKHNTI